MDFEDTWKYIWEYTAVVVMTIRPNPCGTATMWVVWVNTQLVLFLNKRFTGRRYASALYTVIVCPSQVGVIPRRLNLGSLKRRRTIAQGL